MTPEVKTASGYDLEVPANGSRNEQAIRAQGFITENFNRTFAHTTGGALTSGTIFLALVGVKPGDVINNIHFVVETAGTVSGCTLAQGALMDRLGNRLAVTADSAGDRTATESTGLKTFALTSAYTIGAETEGVYVALLTSNGTTTCNAAVGGATVTDQAAVAARTGYFQPNGTAGTSQTAIGTTETVATTSAINFWCALS